MIEDEKTLDMFAPKDDRPVWVKVNPAAMKYFDSSKAEQEAFFEKLKSDFLDSMGSEWKGAYPHEFWQGTYNFMMREVVDSLVAENKIEKRIRLYGGAGIAFGYVPDGFVEVYPSTLAPGEYRGYGEEYRLKAEVQHERA